MNTTTTRLTRNLDEAMLGGVLAGIADRYTWDPTLLRIVAALVALATGVIPAVLIYIVAWVLIPRAESGGPITAAPEGERAETEAATELTPTAAPAPQPIVDEMTEALRDAADRLGEAATIAADAARRAATEIGEVARRPRVAGEAPATDTPATAAPDVTATTDTPTPTATSEEAPAEDVTTEAVIDDSAEQSSIDHPPSDDATDTEAPDDPDRNPST